MPRLISALPRALSSAFLWMLVATACGAPPAAAPSPASTAAPSTSAAATAGPTAPVPVGAVRFVAQ